MQPRIPQHVVTKPRNEPGGRFLKAIQDMPENMCTCCHQMFFRSSAKHFTKDINAFSATVKRALCDRN